MANDFMLQKVIEKIEAKYGDLTNESGCYIHTDNGYQWLSVSNIVDIIESVDERYGD